MASRKRTSTKRKADEEPSDSQPSNAKQHTSVTSRANRKTRRSATRECTICMESHATMDFPKLPGCPHAADVCTDCFGSWIAAQIDVNKWNEIHCPHETCEIILEHHHVRKYASKEVYERFDEMATRSALNADPDFVWCRAPNCGAGQIHTTGEDGNIFRCAQCGFRVCFIHEDTWHENETCEQYDARMAKEVQIKKEQQEASDRIIEATSKKCPNKDCGVSIQKNGGCNHMTCSRCGYEFCWMCLADYEKIRQTDNSAHDFQCPNYFPVESSQIGLVEGQNDEHDENEDGEEEENDENENGEEEENDENENDEDGGNEEHGSGEGIARFPLPYNRLPSNYRDIPIPVSAFDSDSD